MQVFDDHHGCNITVTVIYCSKILKCQNADLLLKKHFLSLSMLKTVVLCGNRDPIRIL